MNNNNMNMSNIINMISQMDKNQLANGLNQLNNILSNEDKMKLMQALKNQK